VHLCWSIPGGGQLLVALRVRWWSDSAGAVAMTPLLGELRPVTDAHVDNAWRLRNCNGHAGCDAIPIVVFRRSYCVWGCGLFVFALYSFLYPFHR
jgi:hypothetical protein